MRSAAATVARDDRRGPHRPQHGLPGAEGLQDRRGRGADRRPRPRGRGGARRARGLGPAGHREDPQRPARRRPRAASISPTGSSTRPASRRSAFTRARRRCTTRARPTSTSPASSCATLARAGDPQRRDERPRLDPARVRAHRLRGGHARARRARQPVAVRAAARHARRASRRRPRSSPSSSGSCSAPSSTSGERRAGRYLRKFYPWYVDRLGGSKALQAALQATDTHRRGAGRARRVWTSLTIAA